jgi:hypothetical protein
LIWSITFFAWYTHSTSDDDIEKFKKNWNEEVFSAIELLKQPYNSVMNMPVQKLKSILQWKNKLDEDQRSLIEEMKNG